MGKKYRPEDNDVDGEDWKKDVAEEMGMNTFNRMIEGGANYLLASRQPIEDYHEIVDKYRPKNQRPKEWTRTYDNMLIDYWVFYSTEIQRAMKNPVQPCDRWKLVYRSCLEDLFTNGEWNGD